MCWYKIYIYYQVELEKERALASLGPEGWADVPIVSTSPPALSSLNQVNMTYHRVGIGLKVWIFLFFSFDWS